MGKYLYGLDVMLLSISAKEMRARTRFENNALIPKNQFQNRYTKWQNCGLSFLTRRTCKTQFFVRI